MASLNPHGPKLSGPLSNLKIISDPNEALGTFGITVEIQNVASVMGVYGVVGDTRTTSDAYTIIAQPDSVQPDLAQQVVYRSPI